MAANAQNGVTRAFSLRSLGSVDLATRRVKAPLKVITYDSVYRPSHIEAYGNEMLNESIDVDDPYCDIATSVMAAGKFDDAKRMIQEGLQKNQRSQKVD